MTERGIDLTVFSPRASAMGHHIGDQAVSTRWTRGQQRPDRPGRRPVPGELHRRLPASAVARRPDRPLRAPSCVAASRSWGSSAATSTPTRAAATGPPPPLTDRSWYPFYEAMVELDVPAMVHVSAVTNPNFHATGSHYLNADTTAFMQLLQADLFTDFPDLRLVIPHGGGAVPYHWGRFRGLADMLGRPPLDESRDGQRLLRHLRLPPAGHQPALRRDRRRQHPVRLGDGRRRPRNRPPRPATTSTTPGATSTRWTWRRATARRSSSSTPAACTRGWTPPWKPGIARRASAHRVRKRTCRPASPRHRASR